MTSQPGVLAPVPAFTHSATWALGPETDPRLVRDVLGALRPEPTVVLGIGEPAARLLGSPWPALRPFPAMSGPGVAVPSTQGALWTRCAGADPGHASEAHRRLEALLAPAFSAIEVVPGFVFDGGRDLTGYADGTENPKGDAADAAAFDEHGASFVSVQRWVHDLGAFEAHPPAERDAMIGRTRADDLELADAPTSAHVKRTAQESFSPAAFLVRRSTPFDDGRERGLLFVAFARSPDPFEAQLRRMVGLEDGVVDALFRFSRPTSGGTYACPPLGADGRLRL